MFPKLKVKMEQLLKSIDLKTIDQWYIETLPQFYHLQTEVEVKESASEELLKILEEEVQSYTPTVVPDNVPLMDIEVTVPNGFAEIFTM